MNAPEVFCPAGEGNTALLFDDWAQCLRRIESESTGRDQTVHLLATLFSKARSAEVERLVRLCRGEIRAGPGTGDEHVSEVLLLEPIGTRDEPPTVEYVYTELVRICQSGSGLREQRQHQLLARIDRTNFHWVQRLLDPMSTPPISDATIIDALALVHSDDVDVGQAINHAYNCMADLGLVARLLWETGAKPLLSAKPKVGVPVHPESQTRRRLVELDQVWQDFGECWVHTKYDGYRCQIHKLDEDVRLFVGRAVGDWSERLPMVVYAVRKQIDARSVILDSEVVPYDDAAKRILPRKEFHKAKTYKVIVFDLLSLDGEDWRRYPYSERHAMKLNLVRQHVDPGVVDFSRDKYVTSSRQLHEFAERCKRAGEEGFIAIRPSATYQSSYSGIRSRDRLKVKAVDPVDAVIVGYDVSSARTSNDAVAFLVAAYDTERDEFVTIGKAVSGLTAVERDCLQRHCRDLEVEHIPPGVNSRLRPDHWVKPQLVVELEVDYIYPSEEYTCGLAQEGVGYGMQNAVFVSGEPRDDKGPEQATTAVEFLLIRREPGLIPFRPASDERSSYTDPSEPTAQQSQLRLFW